MELLTTIFTLSISFILPLAILGYLIVNNRKYLVAYLFGALTFLVFQVLTRMPLIQIYLPNFSWYFQLAYDQPYLYALFLGVTAALFEEIGRYLVIRYFMRKRLSFNDALYYGLGHGGIEALLLVGINALFMIIYYQGQNGAPLMMILAGIERLSTMVIHVVLSIIVMYGIKRKSIVYLLIAIVLHFVLDSSIVIAQLLNVNIITIEVMIVVCAVIAFIYILRFKAKWRSIDEVII